MSDLVCPGCGYTFKTKRSLTKHFNRKYSCTPGYAFPDTHVAFNKACKCKTCHKAFSHSSGLYRHKKDCQGAPKPSTQKNNPVTPNTTGLVNVTFQGNNNNVHVPVNVDNRQYVINIVPYDPNTPPQVSHEKFVSLMKGGGAEHTILKLVEDGHFDPEKPETMNVYISNLKDRVGRFFVANNWEVCDADDLQREVFDLYTSSVDRMIEDTGEDTVAIRERMGNKFPCLEKQIKRWERQTGFEMFDEHAKKKVGLLLYNRRNMVKRRHNLKY